MLLHEALKQHFANDATLKDAPFFYLVIPQATALEKHMPCVVYSRNGTSRQVTHCYTDSTIKTSITLDTYALRYADAHALAALVRQSLIDYRGQLGGGLPVHAISLENDFDLVDIEPGLFRVSQGWDVWHQEE